MANTIVTPLRRTLIGAAALLAVTASAATAMPSQYPGLDGRQAQGLQLEVGNFDADEETEVVMENRWLRVVFEPDHGGAVSSFYLKDEQLELAKRAVRSAPGGWFRHFAPKTPSLKDWYYNPFTVKVVSNTPELAVLELSAKGRTGAYTGITFTKRFTMTADSARLRVDHVIANDATSVEPLAFKFTVNNCVGVPEHKGGFFWAGERGVYRQPIATGNNTWDKDPGGAFCGYVSNQHDGVAFLTDYRLLEQFYCFTKNGTLPRGVLEWYTTQFPVPADGKVEITDYVLPFSGIAEPDGVTPEVVAAIDTTAVTRANETAAVTIRIASAVNASRRAAVTVRRLYDGKPAIVLEQDLDLATRETITLNAAVSVREPGTHEVTLTLYDGKRAVGHASAPMVVEREHVPYIATPPAEPAETDAIPELPKDFNFTSRDVVTPHVPWAARYAGGTTSLFTLHDGYAQREAVELAQRFDMDPATSFLTPGLSSPAYALGGFEKQITTEDLVAQLELAYAQHEKADVIVLSGPVWQWLTPWMQNNLIDRVKRGTGLVWIAPPTLDGEIASALPVVFNPKKNPVQGVTAQAESHFITRGIPWPLIDGFMSTVSEARDGAQVLATVTRGDETYPLVVTGRYGEGRVVALNTLTKYAGASAGHNLTPVRSRGEDPPHHNHEYELSLLARAAIWAGRREADTSLDAAVKDGELRVRIDSLQAADAELEVTFRDRFSNVIERATRSLTLTQGATRATIAMPVLPNGINAAECILRNDGITLDWHVAAVAKAHAAAIESFAADKAVYEKGSPVTLTAATTGGARVRIIIRDAHDRTIIRRTAPVTDRAATFQLDIPRPSTLRLTAVAQLLDDDGGIVAVDRAYIDYRHIPQPDDLMISFGWPGVTQYGLPPYLMKPMYDALKRAGMTGWFHKPGSNCPEELDAARAADLPIQLTSGPLHPGEHVIPNHLRKQYEETGDVTHLRRRPLVGEAFEKQLREKTEQLASLQSVQWGTFDFYNGDESMYQPHDLDLSFDDVSLAHFRDWLKEKYNTLDALNAEWRTDFTAWDSVTPMTRAQVADHPSWAPWLDHRMFNDEIFARAYRLAKMHINELMPGMRSGASGTANTEKAHGWNWWLMRDAFDSLQPYGGDQTYQQRAFMVDVPQTRWLGYGERDVDQYIWKIWRYLSYGSMRGFNVFSGRNHANPDLTLPPTADALRAALDTVTRGQARAFFAARPELDTVAYHYSPRSIWTTIPFGVKGAMQDNSNGMTYLLLDANVQYDYVADEQVEEGILDEGRHKLLFLRAAAALSDNEADAIRRFVRAGGVVVADLLPGVLNEHGSPRQTAALDDVFGIRQQGKPVLGKGELTAEGEAHGIAIGALHTEIHAAAPMTTTTATALGRWEIASEQGPALTVNRFGDGLAVCFGANLLTRYPHRRMQRHTEPGRAALSPYLMLRDTLLDAAGARPTVRVVDVNGKVAPLHVFRLRGRDVTFVSLIADGSHRQTQDVTVQLPRPAHVFNLKTGQRIGSDKIDAIDLTIDQYDTYVFVLLDAMPGRLTVSAPPAVKRGASGAIDITIDAAAGAPRDHTLRIETRGPDGTVFEPLTRNVTAVAGETRLWIDAALDEPLGAYTVNVRDVLTGRQVQAQFAISE